MKKILIKTIILLFFGLPSVFAQTQDSEDDGYNQFNAKDFLMYIGAGYGTEAILNYKKLDLYTAKTKNELPPAGVGFEYALFDFFSMGAEMNFFQFKLADSQEAGDIKLFLMKFRYLLYYSFNPVTFYSGGTLGIFMADSPSDLVTSKPDLELNGSLSFSGLAGLRIFLFDSFFIYAEAAYPFPMLMGGLGFKI